MRKKLSILTLGFFLLFSFCGCSTKSPAPPQGFTTQELLLKAYATHTSISNTLKEEQKSISSLLLAVSATQTLVGDYSVFLTQSAQISSVTRFLPLPYAGEISNTTKLISTSLVTLNNASRDIDSYHKALKNYLDSVDHYSASPTLEALMILQEKGNTFLVKAKDMELSLIKISHLLQTFSTFTRSIGVVLEKQQSLANEAKTLFGLTQASNEDQSTLLATQKKLDAMVGSFSKTALTLQQTKQRHERAFYYAFCLTTLTKESIEKSPSQGQ